jgi:hypothetical protein
MATARTIIWEVWSIGSPNPCSFCWSLNGQLFRQGQGPVPTLSTHANCRCSRHYHHAETIMIDDAPPNTPPPEVGDTPGQAPNAPRPKPSKQPTMPVPVPPIVIIVEPNKPPPVPPIGPDLTPPINDKPKPKKER